MFNSKESSLIRQEFWTTFGKYMSPIPSSEGMKVNWVNYRTEIKDVYFRMDTNPDAAVICISIEHGDPEIQQLYFEQFLELKIIMETALGEKWDWQPHISADGKVISRICKVLPGVSVLNKDHWPDLISFFKPRIIALDSFWENAKYSFEALK